MNYSQKPSHVSPESQSSGMLMPGTTHTSFSEYETAARNLKIQFQALDVRGDNPDLQAAFQTASRGRGNALITITSGWLFLQRKRIADLAIENRLPSMFQGSAWVESGGLMSYSSNDIEAFRRAAIYVDRILKGAKPVDLPIEQPTRFEFVINLKTAKQIGLTISTDGTGASGQGDQVKKASRMTGVVLLIGFILGSTHFAKAQQQLAADLVRLNVDTIVASDSQPAVAARKISTTIPIIMIGGRDPVDAQDVTDSGDFRLLRLGELVSRQEKANQ